jgi:pimeloyl-ACP methyl ester carboxylesterase
MKLPIHTIALLLSLCNATNAQIELTACRSADTEAKCAVFPVPEDHANPTGRTISLKLIVLPATGNQPVLDPLFVLDGGPGGAATQMMPFVVESLAPVRRKRAIVVIDQRGTGGSNALNCPPAARHFVVPANAKLCHSQLSAKADLRYYTTLDFVRDLELVRKALRYERINFYGASYGTRVAQLYLREYPRAVRSIILAAPAPMSLVVPGSIAEGSQAALDRIATGCSSDARCLAKYPAVKNPPQSLLDQLDRFQTVGLHMLMYSSSTAARIPWLLQQVADGRADAITQDSSGARRMLTESISLGLHLSVVCNEDLPYSTAPPEVDNIGSVFDKEYRQACAGWPTATVPEDLHDPVESKIPVLMLTGEWDPVTGPDRAAEMKRSLPNSTIVAIPRGGHMFGGFTGCLDGIMAAFLDGRAPNLGCVSKIPSPSFYLSGPAR